MASIGTSAGKAFTRTAGLPGGRLYDAAEAVVWVAGLNLLLVAFTLLGGVVLGLAPALVAGAHVSRARVRGDAQPLVRTFARVWRRELVGANLLLLPFGVLGTLLVLNLWALGATGGVLVTASWVALALVVLAAVLTVTLQSHYDLPRSRYALTAVRYLLHDLPATLLVAATTALAAALTWLLPGLLPVLTLGAWLHAVTAIAISCYVRNDGLVDADRSSAVAHGDTE